MTADEIARLRELAEAATPGPWRPHGQLPAIIFAGEDTVIGEFWKQPDPDDDRRLANARYVTAVDPQTLLRLLDEWDALIEYVEANERSQKAWRSDVKDVRAFLDARDRLRALGLIGGES